MPRRCIYEKRRIDLSGINRVPQLWETFDRYHLEWMIKPLGSYSPTMVQEFFASYRATVVIPMHKYPGLVRFVRQPQLDHTLVRGIEVDIFDRDYPQSYLQPRLHYSCIYS